MTDRILVSIEDGIATATLNRADKHNAVDKAMFEAFIDVGKTLADDRSIRAVVLHGDGENFCAGIDISVFQSGGVDTQGMAPLEGSIANFYQAAAYVWRDMPVPVVAALHGVVFGAGMQIALGADLRYASADTQLSIMETKWGIIPDMSITTTLPGLVPYDKALELACTGRVVSGEEAGSLGLVTAVVDDPLAAARETASQLAGRSPDAIRAIKTLFREAWGDRDAALLRREAELQIRVMALPNMREAVAANMQKRVPDFADAAE